jgi:hypothetical protein
MSFEVSRWCCSHCRRFVRKDKGRVEQHERTCYDNVERRACRTCKEEYWDGGRQCSRDLLNNHVRLECKEAGIAWECEGYAKRN